MRSRNLWSLLTGLRLIAGLVLLAMLSACGGIKSNSYVSFKEAGELRPGVYELVKGPPKEKLNSPFKSRFFQQSHRHLPDSQKTYLVVSSNQDGSLSLTIAATVQVQPLKGGVSSPFLSSEAFGTDRALVTVVQRRRGLVYLHLSTRDFDEVLTDKMDEALEQCLGKGKLTLSQARKFTARQRQEAYALLLGRLGSGAPSTHTYRNYVAVYDPAAGTLQYFYEFYPDKLKQVEKDFADLEAYRAWVRSRTEQKELVHEKDLIFKWTAPLPAGSGPAWTRLKGGALMFHDALLEELERREDKAGRKR